MTKITNVQLLISLNDAWTTASKADKESLVEEMVLVDAKLTTDERKLYFAKMMEQPMGIPAVILVEDLSLEIDEDDENDAFPVHPAAYLLN